MVSLLISGQEDGNDLVSAFANLGSSLLKAYLVAEFEQSLLPCERMEIHEVQQRRVMVLVSPTPKGFIRQHGPTRINMAQMIVDDPDLSRSKRWPPPSSRNTRRCATSA